MIQWLSFGLSAGLGILAVVAYMDETVARGVFKMRGPIS